MPSPFPGMDPFLEDPAHWPAFHHQFVAALYQCLLPSLVDRYRARVASRGYTIELPLFTSIQRDAHAEEYLEIRDRSDGKPVTLLDVVSPANRTTQAGRDAYLATRRRAEHNRVSLIEIDLITQGEPMLDFPRDNLPEYDCTVTVTRPNTPGRFEIYTATVQKKLPPIRRLPLAIDDNDVALDLQDAFRRAYDLSGLGSAIDYTSDLPPEVKLSDANRHWLDTWLKQQKRR
jgi:Protein of unknown function (DUF4058)